MADIFKKLSEQDYQVTPFKANKSYYFTGHNTGSGTGPSTRLNRTGSIGSTTAAKVGGVKTAKRNSGGGAAYKQPLRERVGSVSNLDNVNPSPQTRASPTKNKST